MVLSRFAVAGVLLAAFGAEAGAAPLGHSLLTISPYYGYTEKGEGFMGTGLEGQEPLRPIFVANADGGKPLTHTMLMNAPVKDWEAIIGEHEKPSNVQTFKHNLERGVDTALDRAKFNLEHQIDRMIASPKNQLPDMKGQNPMVQALYEQVGKQIEAVPAGADDRKEQLEVIKEQVGAIVGATKEAYGTAINKAVEQITNPPQEQQPAPVAPSDAAPSAPAGPSATTAA